MNSKIVTGWNGEGRRPSADPRHPGAGRGAGDGWCPRKPSARRARLLPAGPPPPWWCWAAGWTPGNGGRGWARGCGRGQERSRAPWVGGWGLVAGVTAHCWSSPPVSPRLAGLGEGPSSVAVPGMGPGARLAAPPSRLAECALLWAVTLTS